MSSSPIVLRKAQVKRKPRFDEDENNENNSSQLINPFDDFSQNSTMETTISFSKAACEEQEQSSQASLPSRRRLQRVADKRQPLEIRYEAEEIKPIEKIIEEDDEREEICEIESSKPSNKFQAELDSLANNKCSQRSRRILKRLESNLIDRKDESEDEEVIEEEPQEEIIPKRSLAEIPDLIRINNEKKKTCVELTIQDVTIYFPYKPYKAQIEYMTQVIDALNKGENALLQSPSGSGKTLSLLCACFGWINKRREEYKNSERKFEYEQNQIVLSTKTFSQINQIIEELSKTCYEPIKSILGSKENLCVNKRVLKDESVSINEGCKIERLKQKCNYYSEYKQNRGQHIKMYEDTLPDIEELMTAAKNEKYCPFYLQQDLITLGRADLILIPHNYILEEGINKTTGLDLKHAILIFDDAHHVDSGAEEGSSLTISLEALKEINFQPLKNKLASGLIQTNGLNEEVLLAVETIIQRMMYRLQAMKDNFEGALITVELEVTDNEDDEAEAAAKALALARGEIEIEIEIPVEAEVEKKDEINDGDDKTKKKKRNYTKRKDKKDKKTKKITTQNYDYLPTGVTIETTSKGSEIFSIFNEITSDSDENGDSLFKGITEEDFPQFLEMLSLVHQEFAQTAESTGELEGLIAVVESIFMLCLVNKEAKSNGKEEDFNENLIHSYYLTTYLDSTATRDDYCISLTCVNPAIGFLSIKSQSPRNILLTSAALKPFDSFESELMTQFPIKFNNSHAIDSSVQCLTAIVTYGPTNLPLDFSAANKSSIELYTEMGVTLVRIAKFVPNGIVVCFPSYFIMKQCLRVWRDSEEKIYQKLDKVKSLFEESNNTKRMIRMIDEYKEAALEEDGAIFFCVARGQVCETADFSDEEARAIVFAGVPNLDLKDREVDKKVCFLNDNQEQTQRMTGNAWYGRQTVRALTQAMGRIIRHQDDYGMIFLCDERFDGLRDALPSWARQNSFVYTDDDWTILKEDIREFFEDAPILIKERNQDSNCLIKSIKSPAKDDEILAEKPVEAPEEFVEEQQEEREFTEEDQEKLLKQQEHDELVKEIKEKIVKAKDEDEEIVERILEEKEQMIVTHKPRVVKEKKEKPSKKRNKEKQESDDDSDDIDAFRGFAVMNKFMEKSQVFPLDILDNDDFSDELAAGKSSQKERKQRVYKKKNQENNDDSLGGFAAMDKSMEESQVIPLDILDKSEISEVVVEKSSQKEKKKRTYKKKNAELNKSVEEDILLVKDSQKEKKKRTYKKKNKENNDHSFEGTQLIEESQVVPLDILGKRTDKLDKDNFPDDDFLEGSQSTKKIKTELEKKENQGNDDDPLGGLAELNKLVLESQIVPLNILGKRTDKLEKNDFSDNFLKGSQSIKKIKMEFENKENQGNENDPLGGLAELNKLVLESQVIPTNILGKRTDKFEKDDFPDDLWKGSQSTKKIKMEFENLKPSMPSIEIHFVENNDVDKYFESSTKSGKQSGKKSGKRSLEQIVFSAIENVSFMADNENKRETDTRQSSTKKSIVKNNDVDNYFESSTTKSVRQSAKKSPQEILSSAFPLRRIENSGFMAADNENKMKIEKETDTGQSSTKKSFVENNDVDNYFESSTKKSVKQSGKKSIEQIVSSAFSFRRIENVGFMSDNENKMKIEKETDTGQSSTKKSLVENNDVDNYFESSTKKSVKQSGKKSLEQIVSSAFSFRRLENNGFMANDENKRETDTRQSSTKKSIMENNDVDKYFESSTKKSVKQSGKKSEKRSLQEILSSTFSVDLLKGSQSTKKIKTDFENLKASKENNFVENNDVDKYFENSTTKSVKQSGKKSPQEVVSSAFPFRRIENIDFMANNEDNMNIESEGDTIKSTISKYLKKTPIGNQE